MVVDTLNEHPELTIGYALPWVEHKGTSINEWKKFTLKSGNKFDEFALYIFALTLKCYIGVVFDNESFWITTETEDLSECEAIFLYKGNLIFEQIKRVETEEEEGEPYIRKVSDENSTDADMSVYNDREPHIRKISDVNSSDADKNVCNDGDEIEVDDTQSKRKSPGRTESSHDIHNVQQRKKKRRKFGCYTISKKKSKKSFPEKAKREDMYDANNKNERNNRKMVTTRGRREKIQVIRSIIRTRSAREKEGNSVKDITEKSATFYTEMPVQINRSDVSGKRDKKEEKNEDCGRNERTIERKRIQFNLPYIR